MLELFRFYTQIDGAGHWMDANAAFSPGAPSSDGVAVCNAGTSAPKTKVMAFPDYYTGTDAYVRIGPYCWIQCNNYWCWYQLLIINIVKFHGQKLNNSNNYGKHTATFFNLI